MKFIKSLTVAAVVLTGVANLAQNVHAGDKGGTVHSVNTVEFIADYSVTAPINPIDPDQPAPAPGQPGGTQPVGKPKPGNNAATGEKGPLSLDVVPNLDFGKLTVKNTSAMVKNEMPFIQVTDNRGTGAGWSLTASLNRFTLKGGTVVLKGAKIVFKKPTVKSGNPNDTVLPADGSSVTLDAGGSYTKVLGARANYGRGTWVAVYAPQSAPVPRENQEDKGKNGEITLEFDSASANVGLYSSGINWLLSDAPA